MDMTNFLTIDVEDYFQVSAFENVSPPETWGGRECRVERNTELILEILDERNVTATFFILGWIAKRYPELIRSIASRGHEIASHGFGHQRICNIDRRTFREDIRRSKSLLEEITGDQVYGYRAPSYSISQKTEWAFDELCEADYQYDSSIFPIRHDLYGIPDWSRFAGYAVKEEDGCWRSSDCASANRPSLQELPITTLRIFKRNFPIAGGGYFRLLPYAVTNWGLKKINQQDRRPFIFYLHPWELDPQQPRMKNISLKSRFRHYLNLERTENRFRTLLDDFKFTSIHRGICSSQ